MKWIICVALIATISFNTGIQCNSWLLEECFDFTIQHTVKSESCDTLDYIECEELIAACAVSCASHDGVCELCLGSSYSKCVGCISLTNKINAVQTAPGNATHF